MPEYRRLLIQGGMYFFTVVSNERRPILTSQRNVDLLRRCFISTSKDHPFSLDAIVILPDHLHTIWTLPAGDSDFSTRWRLIKGAFSRHFQLEGERISDSRARKAERGVWQRRFWEHAIRDQEDLNRHVDYIHYNPVKHGLASSPGTWRYSSFSSFVRRGCYEPDWGASVPKVIRDMSLE